MPLAIENRRNRGAVWLLCICLICLAGIPAARAFKLVPITMEFEPSGRGASQAFRVENDSDKPVAVQITMLSRKITIDGKEERAPAEEDFIVYPTQILLKANRSQTVRVKWVGDPRPAHELAYRILAEQLPINFSKEQETGAKINLIVRYLGSIYIVPEGAKPDVVLASVTPIEAEGEKMLALVFHNQGTAHGILRDLTITLKSNGRSVVLGPEDLKGIAGENLLAQSKRRFVLPWPDALPDGKIEAAFDYHRRP